MNDTRCCCHHGAAVSGEWPEFQCARCPRWDEITDAHYGIGAIPEDVTMCMVLPPPAEYVAVHDTTFHLHEMEARS